MPELGALLPSIELSWIGLTEVVVGSAVQPVSVAVYVDLFEVAEFVEGVVL